MALVITGWWVYRGLRKGFYPALNIFLGFFVPLLFTVNYFDLLFGLVGRIAPQTSLAVREAISFCATYLICLTICMYFCLWLCTEKLPLHRIADGVGGAIFGIATGVVSSGVLLMFWFSMPFAERQFPVDDGQMFFPTPQLTMHMATFVANRDMIRGPRSFSGVRFLRDLRYGLPSIPTLGRGYFVASIPNGLRIFVDATGGTPAIFLERIKERLAAPDMDIPPSVRRQPFGERSHSPYFVPEDRGDKGLIALVMDDVPREIADRPAEEMFVHDGEVFYSKEKLGDQVLFIKIYEITREGNIGSVIALFQPQDPEHWDIVEDYLPTQPCFHFEEKEMKNLLLQGGATVEESENLLRQLRLGGKAYFIGKSKEPKVVEMTGPKDAKTFSPEAPDIEAEKRKLGRGRIYW